MKLWMNIIPSTLEYIDGCSKRNHKSDNRHQKAKYYNGFPYQFHGQTRLRSGICRLGTDKPLRTTLFYSPFI